MIEETDDRLLLINFYLQGCSIDHLFVLGKWGDFRTIWYCSSTLHIHSHLGFIWFDSLLVHFKPFRNFPTFFIFNTFSHFSRFHSNLSTKDFPLLTKKWTYRIRPTQQLNFPSQITIHLTFPHLNNRINAILLI